MRLADVGTGAVVRIRLPIAELDRVLGGGLVPGAMVLIAGEPGIGKSTLTLQAAAVLADSNPPVLYVSAEESVQQIKLRTERMGIASDGLYLLADTSLGAIVAHIEALSPGAVVVDSIQTVYAEDVPSAAGSVTQVRECTAQLMRLAKRTHLPIVLVGHVTKTGVVAGPRIMEHMVDTVLYLEGDRYHSYRLLRSTKNRFGPTNEVGVFEMRQEGLVEVPNPSAAFLAERLQGAPGSAVTVTMEGSRPLVVEIQALVSPTGADVPRRTANGLDFNRVLLLAAVLSRRLGLPIGGQDVFVNVVGGLKVYEPAADLAVASAIVSSVRGVPLPGDMVLLGEIGLSGELRSVGHIERRLGEAAKLGFKRAVLPDTQVRKGLDAHGLALSGARTVTGALESALS
jgi:DNA repair protein RadA/Sms